MAAAFVQFLYSAANKTAGTSLVIPAGGGGSKTVTVGNDIFVAFAADTTAGSYSVADSLSNSYSQVHTVSGNNDVDVFLFRSRVTTGGTLASITVSHPSLTARAGIAAEFSGLSSGGAVSTGGQQTLDSTATSAGSFSVSSGELLVGAHGWEGPGGDTLGLAGSSGSPLQTLVEVDDDIGTTGGAATTNVSVGLQYVIGSASASNVALVGTLNNQRDSAGAGARFAVASSGSTFEKAGLAVVGP